MPRRPKCAAPVNHPAPGITFPSQTLPPPPQSPIYTNIPPSIPPNTPFHGLPPASQLTVPPFGGHTHLVQSAPANLFSHPPGQGPFPPSYQLQDDAWGHRADGTSSKSESESNEHSDVDNGFPPTQQGPGQANPSNPTQQTNLPNFAPVNSLEMITPLGTQTPSGTTNEVDSQACSQDAASRHKLQWTGAMEKSAMRLYVQAVEEGKRSDGGFKGEVHRWVASELSRQYPGSAFDASKCKSKLSQTFKELHDAFVECREASGFGWDEARCEVTASDDVWAQFLVSHPLARRFQNQPFPEWFELSIIFGTAATGERSRSIGRSSHQAATQGRPEARQGPRDRASSEEDASQGSPGNKSHPRKRNRKTTGASFENAVDRLITAICGSASSTSESNTAPQSQIAGGSHMADEDAVGAAIQKYQDSQLATELEFGDLILGYTVLEKPSKARVYLQIHGGHSDAWLAHQIETHSSASH